MLHDYINRPDISKKKLKLEIKSCNRAVCAWEHLKKFKYNWRTFHTILIFWHSKPTFKVWGKNLSENAIPIKLVGYKFLIIAKSKQKIFSLWAPINAKWFLLCPIISTPLSTVYTYFLVVSRATSQQFIIG